MRKILVTCSLLSGLFVAAHGQQSRKSADEEAVRTLISQIAGTVQGNGARARTALFADDAQIINAFGERAAGREQIGKFWDDVYSSGGFQTAKSEEKELKIRFLTPKLALVDRFYVFSGQRGPNSGRELPPRDIHLTVIARKAGRRWLIIYYSVADLRSIPARKPQ
jgi:uncharacterized protein (TIGR02246 family)